MTSKALGGSFRDPSGFVFRRNGALYRQIHSCHREHWAHLTASGLLGELWRLGWLVEHEEVGRTDGLSAEAWKVIRPSLVSFISYPYEWCFGQLKDAALHTLRLQRLAMAHGMTLRDASAFNIQFRHSQPVLIDTLSLGRYDEGRPWLAYRQFCQHFVVPLLLMSRVDTRLGLLSRDHLDGIPLDLGAAMLPKATRWRPSIAIHVHLHAATIRRHSATAAGPPRLRGVSRNGLLGILDDLERLITGLDCRVEGSQWWDYEETHPYDPGSREEKERLALAMAGDHPGMTWDLGANTGRFAELVAPRATHVVAMDLDHGAVERHWRRRRRSPAAILPLVMDLTNPSPDLGWGQEERDGMMARGPADTLLALALVHHLAIGENIPLPRIAEWLAQVGHRAIIEWVPKEDPQVQRLVSSRARDFCQYQEVAFAEALAPWFRLVSRQPVGASGRAMYLLERR